MVRALAGDIALPPELTREFLLLHRVCPLRLAADGDVVVAVAPNAFTVALDDIHLAYRRPVVTEEHSAIDVERLIERLTTEAERLVQLEEGDAASEQEGVLDDGERYTSSA